VPLAEAAAALLEADEDDDEPEVVDVGTGAVVDGLGVLVVVVDWLIPPVMTDPVKGGLDQSVDVEGPGCDVAASEVPAVIAVIANEGLVLPESPNTDQAKHVRAVRIKSHVIRTDD